LFPNLQRKKRRRKRRGARLLRQEVRHFNAVRKGQESLHIVDLFRAGKKEKKKGRGRKKKSQRSITTNDQVCIRQRGAVFTCLL